jgi:hypothetical protein
VVRIEYGDPGPDLLDRAERGNVWIGGCVITGDDPKWHCKACGEEFK